ncbi:MAG: sigma-54-dependent Fis family transcriptional regulator, partial [Ignavibacteria bacterium]|nr:sigma-54-dependent Fis family transcriptional regulator [Ignavibacteria bacterium]
FTGADKQRIGRFETADGSTIFLDEIGDIPLSTQVKLLRILQENKFERVGSSHTIEVDVRLIAATNKDLRQLIQDGRFREDLFYRLNVVQIELPPLRERKADIIPLIDFCLKKYSPAANKENMVFSREALDYLLKYNYPGNIRELENIVQKAIVLSRGNIISIDDVTVDIKVSPNRGRDSDSPNLNERIESLEKEMIEEALRLTGGNQTQAAKRLGISESNLRYRINRIGNK